MVKSGRSSLRRETTILSVPDIVANLLVWQLWPRTCYVGKSALALSCKIE